MEIIKQTLNDYFSEKKYAMLVSMHDTDNYDDYELYKFSVSYFKLKQYSNCLSVANNISLEFKSNNFFINEIIGESLIKINKFEEAIGYFSNAIGINPNLVSAKHNLLILKVRFDFYIKKSDIDECFSRALSLKNIFWLREISYIYYNKGFFTEANECINQMYDIKPTTKFHYLDFITYSFDTSFTKNQSISVNDFFEYNYIEKEKDNENLIIIFSPNHGFAFQGYKFNEKYDLLYVNDLTSSYYTFILFNLVAFISNIVSSKSYSKISLVGSSKAGTGALLSYAILKEELSIPINCIVFSPQIDIFPFNKDLIIPSYQQFSLLFEIHPFASYKVSKIPLIRDIKVRNQDHVSVIYGKHSDMDAKEVAKIPNTSNINIVPINFSGHASSIPYTIPDGKSIDDLKITYGTLNELIDVDFQALGGGRTIDLVDEIWRLYYIEGKKLRNLIDKFHID